MDKKDSNSLDNQNLKGTPVSRSSVSDNVDKVFTSTPNQSSSYVPPNGPLFNDELEPSSPFSGYEDALRTRVTTRQSQICKANPIHDTEVTPSTSGKMSSSAHNITTKPLQDGLPCPKVLSDNGCTSMPSTSGLCKSDNADSKLFKENRKRPSSLRLKDADDSSSDTENEDYSLGSKDGCIYTYRGGEHLADLPSSFFSLDMGLPLDNHLPLPPNYPVPIQGNREQGSGASSPDMDFLEMDFDPVPSCEVETSEESTSDDELDPASNMSEDIDPIIRVPSSDFLGASYDLLPSVSNLPEDVNINCNHGSTSNTSVEKFDAVESSTSYGIFITHTNAKGEEILVRRTMAKKPAGCSSLAHLCNGDMLLPKGFILSTQPASAPLKSAEAPKSDADNQAVAPSGDEGPESGEISSASNIACVEPPRCMIWSEDEASKLQITQIGTSACGVTAVINAFNALGFPVDLEKINSAVVTRLRAEISPIPRYILSRAVAGCTAADLVSGIQSASDGAVTARFFPTFPERAVSLSHWLADWMSLGAVAILTMNLQAGCAGDIPDAWHHQMVYGVSPEGVYLCNPLECISENALWPRLTSPSILLVRARDVLSRFTPNTDLTPLTIVPDRRYQTFNVLGQVVNVIREWRAAGWTERGTRTRHIRVPASYQPGITIAVLTGSQAHIRLTMMPQLPALGPQSKPDEDKCNQN